MMTMGVESTRELPLRQPLGAVPSVMLERIYQPIRRPNKVERHHADILKHCGYPYSQLTFPLQSPNEINVQNVYENPTEYIRPDPTPDVFPYQHDIDRIDEYGNPVLSDVTREGTRECLMKHCYTSTYTSDHCIDTSDALRKRQEVIDDKRAFAEQKEKERRKEYVKSAFPHLAAESWADGDMSELVRRGHLPDPFDVPAPDYPFYLPHYPDDPPPEEEVIYPHTPTEHLPLIPAVCHRTRSCYPQGPAFGDYYAYKQATRLPPAVELTPCPAPQNQPVPYHVTANQLGQRRVRFADQMDYPNKIDLSFERGRRMRFQYEPYNPGFAESMDHDVIPYTYTRSLTLPPVEQRTKTEIYKAMRQKYPEDVPPDLRYWKVWSKKYEYPNGVVAV